MSAKDAEKALKELNLKASFSGSEESVTAQIPAAGQSVPGGSEILVYLGEPSQVRTVKVPDFTGMTRQQASAAAGSLGLYILVSGNGDISPSVTVTAQSIPAGTEAKTGDTIQLRFTDTGARD